MALSLSKGKCFLLQPSAVQSVHKMLVPAGGRVCSISGGGVYSISVGGSRDRRGTQIPFMQKRCCAYNTCDNPTIFN